MNAKGRVNKSIQICAASNVPGWDTDVCWSTPLLGAICGIFTGLCLTILLMARLIGEELLLRQELEGYREYMENVRYRLVPGIL